MNKGETMTYAPKLCASIDCTKGDDGGRKVFQPHAATQMYCSMSCGTAAQARRRKAKAE